LHEWTRSEKTKLKKNAQSEASATGAPAVRTYDDEKQQQQAPVPNCAEEKPSSADAESSFFDGEMDNFQTPLVRYAVSCSFLRTM